MFLMRFQAFFRPKVMALTYWGGPHRNEQGEVVATMVTEAPSSRQFRAELEMGAAEIDHWLASLSAARASIDNYNAREVGQPDPWVFCAECHCPMKADDPAVVRTPAPESETFCATHSPYKAE